MRSIAIIPARSGSKGLPDKNIKPLNGKPLLAYSIEAALASGMFDTVHVSTDSGATPASPGSTVRTSRSSAAPRPPPIPLPLRMPSGRCCAAMGNGAAL